MHSQDYAKIIQSICARLGEIEPDNTIIRNVTQYCKKLDLSRLRELHPNKNDMLLAIVESYVGHISSSDEFDYSDYLHKKASTPNTTEESKLINWIGNRMPVIASKSMSIYFDSRMRRNDMTDTITDFGFTLVPRTMATVFGDGNIQARVMPSQITYFKIGKLSLPYALPMRASNFSNEITLTFTGLRSNGIIGSEDTYHFVFTYTEKNDNIVELTPNNEYCKFSPPLRYVDNMSFRLNDPVIPIGFVKDRMYVNTINYLSSDGRLTFESPHGLQTGDVVIIDGLVTQDDAANKNILSKINSRRGLPITVINSSMISIGLDFSTIVSPDMFSKPLVIFYSKTFRFPLEIGYQDVVELN